ncbi:MAG: hypothetical protein Q8R36_04650 [bacterium]|nr:hypothetical protein [bacterium]
MREFTSVSAAMVAVMKNEILGFEIVRRSAWDVNKTGIVARVRKLEGNAIEHRLVGYGGLEGSGTYANLGGSRIMDEMLRSLLEEIKEGEKLRQEIIIRELCKESATT